jgi:hypothetical protein
MPAARGAKPTQQVGPVRIARGKKVHTQGRRHGKLGDELLHKKPNVSQGHLSKGRRRTPSANVMLRKSEQAVRQAARPPHTVEIENSNSGTIEVYIDGNLVTSASKKVETYTYRLVGFLVGKVKDQLKSIDAADIDLYSIGSPEDVAESMAAVLPASHPFDAVIGPFYDTAGVARRLQVSTSTVHHRARQHHLLACPTAEGALVYPTWQFGPDGTPLPGLDAVVETLSKSTDDRWQIALWLRTASAQLKDETPHEALRRGKAKSVQLLAEQTAARWQH